MDPTIIALAVGAITAILQWLTGLGGTAADKQLVLSRVQSAVDAELTAIAAAEAKARADEDASRR